MEKRKDEWRPNGQLRRFEAVKQNELICSFGLHEKEGPEMREQDERERGKQRDREKG